MKFYLFFRTTNLKEYSTNFSTQFFALYMLLLLCIPSIFSAAALDTDSLDQRSKQIIFVSGNAVVYGESNVYNAKIVKVSEPKEDNATKNVLGSKRENSKVPESLTKKNTAAAHPKPAKPKHIFNSTSSNESFGASNALDNKNSVCNPTLVVASFIVCHYTKLSIASYIYLLNIYSADFSKIAELSQFRFSRPPPMI